MTQFKILIINMSKVIGVSRTLKDIGGLAKWNTKLLQWIITHNTPTQTRQHAIQLYMVMVSSERIVRVDDVEVLRTLVFGFSCQFDIGSQLKGKIVQDGLHFQLFVNGDSFENLSKKEYGYEPLKLQFEEKNCFDGGVQIKQTINKKQVKVEEKPVQKISNITKNIKKLFIIAEQKPKVEDSLKKAQDQIMKIMIEQKRRKRQEQAKKDSI